MKKCYLDSNVLIYLKNEDSPYYAPVNKLITRLVEKNTTLFISPLVLDEFLHSFLWELRRKEIKNTFNELKRAVKEIFSLPDIYIVNPPNDFVSQLNVIDLMEEYSLRPRDAYHLLVMLTNQISNFATLDNDFKKVFATKKILKA